MPMHLNCPPASTCPNVLDWTNWRSSFQDKLCLNVFLSSPGWRLRRRKARDAIVRHAEDQAAKCHHKREGGSYDKVMCADHSNIPYSYNAWARTRNVTMASVNIPIALLYSRTWFSPEAVIRRRRIIKFTVTKKLVRTNPQR